MSAYSASKAAVRNLARSWAEDLKGTGIRVNVLSPGCVDQHSIKVFDPSIKGETDRFAFRFVKP